MQYNVSEFLLIIGIIDLLVTVVFYKLHGTIEK